MDLDGDGHLDLISGSYSPHDVKKTEDMAGLLYVLRGQPGGGFAPAEIVNGTDGQPLIIPAGRADITKKICTRPFAVDWNNDGALDLVVGNFAGTFYWFKGEGKGKFDPKPEAIDAGGQPLINKGYHGDPFVVDWDGDGDLDILSGSGLGGVGWSENTAGKGKLPELKPFRALIEAPASTTDDRMLSESDLTGPLHSTRVWVADFNGDKKLDLLVGDNVMLESRANGISAEEFKKRSDEWKAAAAAVREKAVKATTDSERQEAQRAVAEHYRKRSEFIIEDQTGFVWLFLQQ